MVVSQPYGYRLIPAVHEAVTPPNPQQPVLYKTRLLHRLPKRPEPARILPLLAFPDTVFYACRAVCVDLGGPGTKVRFLLERYGELGHII